MISSSSSLNRLLSMFSPSYVTLKHLSIWKLLFSEAYSSFLPYFKEHIWNEYAVETHIHLWHNPKRICECRVRSSPPSLVCGCGSACATACIFKQALDRKNPPLRRSLKGTFLGIDNTSNSRWTSVMWMLVLLLKYLISPRPTLHTVRLLSRSFYSPSICKTQFRLLENPNWQLRPFSTYGTITF